MSIYEVFLVCAALIPALILCVYVYKKDRVEKEPIGLLLLLLGVGALMCFPAARAEGVLGDLLNMLFLNFAEEIDGVIYLGDFAFRVYNFIDYFFDVALVEEGLKFIALLLVTRNNKNFNSMFDGMIYAIFVSIGFAGLENVLYVLKYGFATAVSRAFTAVPGHMFFAVMMGYYYSFWKLSERTSQFEGFFRKIGLVESGKTRWHSKKYLVLSLIVAVVAHGFYDYCLSIDSFLAIVAFNLFLFYMYLYCFHKIRKLSKIDGYTDNIAIAILLKKHPHLREHLEKLQTAES